jgi:hypothetical protein
MARPGLGVRFVTLAACGLTALGWLCPRAATAQESWDAIYIGKSKVGHMHVRVEPVKDAQGRDLVRVRVDWELTFKRGKDQAKTQLAYGTIEKPDGTVLRLDTRTLTSQDSIRTSGEVDLDKQTMTLTIESGGRSQQQVIPWTPDVRGPYGAEMSLARQPIEPGQTREIKTYIPDLNQVCLTKLTARAKEPVKLGGETRSLLKVDQLISDIKGTPLPGMHSTLWVDDGGQILKSSTDLVGNMLTYRTTKEGALAPDGGDFDLLARSIIKVPLRITEQERRRDILYRITVRDDDPATLHPDDRRQTVRKQGAAPGTVQLEVRTAGPNAGDPGPEQVDSQYLRPNPLVDSNNSLVVEAMNRAIAGKNDPWSKAVTIVEWVAENVKTKNFNTAFAPAGEVARDLSGDCSEHSVLTAAMCRASGIPARCIVGLVYVDHLGGFGFHMWNEVYVNRRWVAIDAAFRQSEVDATHIKLSDTSLDGVAPFEALLPVIRVFDKMKIEPLELR